MCDFELTFGKRLSAGNHTLLLRATCNINYELIGQLYGYTLKDILSNRAQAAAFGEEKRLLDKNENAKFVSYRRFP